jgi:hypothetical protein
MSILAIGLVCWFICSLVLALPTAALLRERSSARRPVAAPSPCAGPSGTATDPHPVRAAADEIPVGHPAGRH